MPSRSRGSRQSLFLSATFPIAWHGSSSLQRWLRARNYRIETELTSAVSKCRFEQVWAQPGSYFLLAAVRATSRAEMVTESGTKAGAHHPLPPGSRPTCQSTSSPPHPTPNRTAQIVTTINCLRATTPVLCMFCVAIGSPSRFGLALQPPGSPLHHLADADPPDPKPLVAGAQGVD